MKTPNFTENTGKLKQDQYTYKKQYKNTFSNLRFLMTLVRFSLFLCFFVSLFYVYYLYKYPQIHNTNFLLKYYPQDLILKTGGRLKLPESRIQHFLNFHPEKTARSIRIGAFGDSYTYGDEVEKTESYPYQLQELFNQKFPNKKIEVLNFGVSGSSFQEQFFLWEKYAKNYGLDYILIGPRGLHQDRGLTFAMNYGFKYLAHPKTRFFLNKNGLARIHIKGDTLKKRYKSYYKIIPSHIALRYDKRPFQIWERLIPILRDNIQNPFYYTKMPQWEESVKINIFLLEKIKNLYDQKILFFTSEKSRFNDYKSVKNLYNLNYVYFEKKSNSRFYRVYGDYGHNGSLGNEIVAKIYFNGLIGKKKFFLNTINCHFKNRSAQLKKSKLQNYTNINSFSKKWDGDLFKIKSIQLTDGNNVIASLRHNSPIHHHDGSSYFNHKTKGIKSFISFFSSSRFLNSSFIPLSIQLKEGMSLYIQLKDKTRVSLGPIQALDTHKKLFVFYSDFIRGEAGNHYQSYFIRDKLPYELKKQIENLNHAGELFVEDYKLGKLQHYNLNETKLIPMDGYEKTFLMMGAFSNQTREKKFSDKFPLYIQYKTNNGELFKSLMPKWHCKKEKQLVDLHLPNFKPINLH